MAIQYIFSSTSYVRLSNAGESSGILTVSVVPIKPIAQDLDILLLCHACGKVLESHKVIEPFEGEEYLVSFNVGQLESSGHPGPYEFYHLSIYPGEITVTTKGVSVPPEGGTTNTGITYPPDGFDSYDSIHGTPPLDYLLWASSVVNPGWKFIKRVRENGDVEGSSYKSHRIKTSSSHNYVYTSYFERLSPLSLEVRIIDPGHRIKPGNGIVFNVKFYNMPSAVEIRGEGVYTVPREKESNTNLYGELISVPDGIDFISVALSVSGTAPATYRGIHTFTPGGGMKYIPGTVGTNVNAVLFVRIWSDCLVFDDSEGALVYTDNSIGGLVADYLGD